MTVAIVQGGTTNTATGTGTSLSKAFASNVSSSNQIFAMLSLNGTTTLNSITGGGGTWTIDAGPISNAFNSENYWFCHCENPSGGATTVQANFAASVAADIQLYEVSGLQASGSYSTTYTNTGTSTAIANSFTPSRQPAFAMAWLDCASAGNITASGVTDTWTNDRSFVQFANERSMSLAINSTGSRTADGTIDTSQAWKSMAAIYLAAPSVITVAAAGNQAAGSAGNVSAIGGVINNNAGSVLGFGPTASTPLSTVAAGAGSPDVTVAATGVSGTGQVGYLVPNLEGNTGTGAVGALAPQISVGLTNVVGTGAVGTLIEGDTTALTGVVGTGAVGTLVPGITEAATGVVGTGAVGIITPGLSSALSGVTATGGVGTVAVAFDIPLTGVVGTGAVGTMTASTGGDVTVAAIGVSGTGQVGYLVPNLEGNTGTGAAGTLVPQLSLGLTGAAGTGAVGSLAPAIDAPLGGNTATGALGTVTPGLSLVLTGIAGTGTVGTLTASTGGDVTVAATGVSATGAVGTLIPSGAAAEIPYTNPNYNQIHGGGGAGNGQPIPYDWRSINDLFKKPAPPDIMAQLLAEDEMMLLAIMASMEEIL